MVYTSYTQYGISSFSYHARRPFHPQKFFDFLHDTEGYGKLIRSKGYFWLATRPEFAGHWSQAGGIANPRFKTSTTMSLNKAPAEIGQFAEGSIPVELAESIVGHVNMFCRLFEINTVEVNLTVINDVMCPRFHTDRVPCRLITSYCGPATEWLPHLAVDRSKLGRGNNGLPDHLSGVYSDKGDIQQLAYGDVALLKGTLWSGNEDSGQVHRSPLVGTGEKRLLLTLDFVD